MAKIKDLKFEIAGEQFSVPVNCTSKGEFTAKLPVKVSDALALRGEMSASSLKELESQFFSAVKRYKEAETKQDLFILIQYASCGSYKYDSKGFAMFSQHGNKYQLEQRSFNDIDALGFDFMVAIKETVDGVEKWYQARKPSDSHFDKDKDPNKYYKGRECYGLDKYKKIPFSEKALDTLTVGRERIRQISEMLFNFIEQDEKMIEQKLTNQKLLS